MNPGRGIFEGIKDFAEKLERLKGRGLKHLDLLGMTNRTGRVRMEQVVMIFDDSLRPDQKQNENCGQRKCFGSHAHFNSILLKIFLSVNRNYL